MIQKFINDFLTIETFNIEEKFWVCFHTWGDRKCTFKTTTVTHMLNVSRIMVNKTNLPRRGTTRDVGGMISDRAARCGN